MRLGFYTLAGAPEGPRDLLAEVADGEAMGLDKVFISERFTIKEAATISGAVGAVSERLDIATAATNHTTRHPMVTASYATTMHRLTGGRFTLGLGRGIGPLFDAIGLPRSSSTSPRSCPTRGWRRLRQERRRSAQRPSEPSPTSGWTA